MFQSTKDNKINNIQWSEKIVKETVGKSYPLINILLISLVL